ncbi:MAG TPA: ATP-dependent helicase HrpB, partial [Rhodospirillaceae bacterium]|nr:ATP-dependent helicase HrpB [Rhodospirillaceae bacterium]
PAFTPAEMVDADLAPLALDLARWGVTDPGVLAWLDPPPAAAFAQAGELLRRLGALGGDGRITAHGRVMAALPLHPRLAHMVVTAKGLGLGGLACDLAALLSEPDPLKDRRDADLRLRLEALGDRRLGPIREAARQLRRQCGVSGDDAGGAVGLVLAFAYPDRIALSRGGDGLRYRLSNGRGAFFAEPQPLAGDAALSVAELDGDKREARILLAAPLSLAEIRLHFAADIEDRRQVTWDGREQTVLARRQRRLGELVLEDLRWEDAPAEAVTAAMLDGVRNMGLACLPWTPASDGLRQRVACLRHLDGAEAWPDLSDAALLSELERWLAPWLAGMLRRAHLERLDMATILQAMLSWEQRKVLDAQAPTHLEVPSGSRVPIDYGSAEMPILAVRLQEMFGLADTPTVAGGRIRLTLHLLSPARRPVQVTQDLASFWANAYRQVRSDLRGQYPRHYWPDNPLEAEPTARTNRPRTPKLR